MRNIWLIIKGLRAKFPLKSRATVINPDPSQWLSFDPYFVGMSGEVIGHEVWQEPGEPTTFLVVLVMDDNRKASFMPDSLIP